MKIYSRGKFASGIFMILLGAINIIADIATQKVEPEGIILAIALFFFGFAALRRATSKKLFREDRLEDLDERNQLIELRSKSKSFNLTQTISFILLIAALVAAKLSGNEIFIGIAVGLAFSYTVSMLAEISTYFYYESHN